ncbi:2,3-dehydroadipyl-CoA hydratase [Enterobacter cloacae]|nr:2,3-dehydroadipyl-CoA hydratase [Enterobacter cloacae]
MRGIAYGGGCELALACDIAIAGHSARFAVPEVKLGVIPGAGGTQRLVHAVGKAKAMRMLLSGDAVDAAWACDAGLVADVVDDDEVVPAAIGLARRIAGNAPRAVALAADAARRAHETRHDLVCRLLLEKKKGGVYRFRDGERCRAAGNYAE